MLPRPGLIELRKYLLNGAGNELHQLPGQKQTVHLVPICFVSPTGREGFTRHFGGCFREPPHTPKSWDVKVSMKFLAGFGSCSASAEERARLTVATPSLHSL